jgi:hypothetical protein
MKTETCAVPHCTRPTGHAIGDDSRDERICIDCKELYGDEVRAIIEQVRDGDPHSHEEILQRAAVASELGTILITHLVASKRIEKVSSREYRGRNAAFADILPDADRY